MERLEELYGNYIKYRNSDKISETTKSFMKGDITTSRTFLKESLEDIIKYQLPAPVEIKEWITYNYVKDNINTGTKRQLMDNTPTSMNMTINVIRWYEIEILGKQPTPMERKILEYFMNGKEIKEIAEILNLNVSTVRNAIMAMEFPRVEFKPTICNIRDNFDLQTFMEWDFQGKGEEYLDNLGFRPTEYSTVYNLPTIKDNLYNKRKNMILNSYKKHGTIIGVSKDTGFSSYLIKRILHKEGKIKDIDLDMTEGKRFYGKASRTVY